MCQGFISLCGRIIFNFMDIPHFVYILPSWWAFFSVGFFFVAIMNSQKHVCGWLLWPPTHRLCLSIGSQVRCHTPMGGIAWPTISLCLTFWGIAILLSTGATLPYVCEVSNFSTSLPAFILFSLFFNYNHTSWCKWHLTVALICIFLIINDANDLFVCFLAIWISPLE